MYKENSLPCKLALNLIADCRKHSIKTVFYSKEDPPNFDLFKIFAVPCDYVFTSCEEKVVEYRTLCGHDRVWVMPFCVNPDFSNPINARADSSGKPTVVFSGSWTRKYAQRCKWLQMLLQGVIAAGCDLQIYDRNSWRGIPKWQFPAQFAARVRPAVEHKELAAIHKRCKWGLNANSVTESSTMFAVRVYELLASGVHVISNYSVGMHRRFPAVSIGYSQRTVIDILKKTPESVLEFQRANGIRDTITNYSAHNVLGEMFEHIGLPQNVDMPMVAVIADDEAAAKAALSLQTCSAFKVMGKDSAAACGRDGFAFVMRFSADVEYSPFFIEDAVNTLAYSDVNAFSAGTDEKWWYHATTLEHGDGRYLVARCGTALAEALVSGAPLMAEATCFIMPMSAVDGTVYGNCGVEVAKQQRLNIRISVGADWRGLLLCTMPSLLRCEKFGEFAIVLADVSKDSPLAQHFAMKLARDFANVHVVNGDETDGGRGIELCAGDEVFASSFDEFVAKMEGTFTASVEGDVLLCGRRVRLLKRGISVKTRAHGIVRCMREPVMCRYGALDETVGESYSPLPRKSVIARAVRCYRDKGLWKTLRRVFLGKGRKGHAAAAGGGC